MCTTVCRRRGGPRSDGIADRVRPASRAALPLPLGYRVRWAGGLYAGAVAERPAAWLAVPGRGSSMIMIAPQMNRARAN